MKKDQLFELMSTINDEFIEASVKRRKENNVKTQLRLIISLAACAVLVVGGVAFGVYSMREKAPEKPVDSAETTENAVPYSPDFEVEGDVLIAYKGKDTQVIIPDGIKTIGAYSIRSSSSSDEITAVILNDDVEAIDENAFSGLPSLETVTAPDTNKNFVSFDGMLMAIDGSICFFMIEDDMIDAESLWEKMYNMRNMSDFREKECKFAFGGYTVTVQNMINDTDPELTYFKLKSISAFGRTFELKDSKYYNMERLPSPDEVIINCDVRFLLTEDTFMYSNTRNINGYYLCIREDGVYEYVRHCLEEWSEENEKITEPWYNKPLYYYGTDGLNDDATDPSGNILYVCVPRKYAFDLTPVTELKYCVGHDELAFETGYITFENGEIVHHSQRRYTVYDSMLLSREKKKNGFFLFDINKTFRNVFYDEYGNKRDYLGNMGFPDVNTFEELIEYNSEHYERAYSGNELSMEWGGANIMSHNEENNN